MSNNKIAYYPGCSLHSTAKEYDISTQLVCDRLGIELIEVPHWTCCGATTAHITSELMSIALPMKTLIWAEKEKLPLTTPCAACYSRLKLADHYMKDPAVKKEVNEIVGEEYNGGAEIYHLARIFSEKIGPAKIKEAVKKELKGLKVACYYGCLLTRPKEVCDFDRIENPMFIDNIIRATGAETPKWYFKTECCGAAMSLTKKEVVLKLTGEILKAAKEAGADCIAVACPLCHANLDTRQAEIKKKLKLDLNLPIFYFTQLIGLSMGFNYLDLALNKHFVNPKKLLKEKGFI